MVDNPEYIFQIKKQFNDMNSKEDFLNLLNLTKEALYPNNSYPFSEKQLNYYITRRRESRKKTYHSFKIKKKSGADRLITAPVKGLKQFQTVLNNVFQIIYEPYPAATGFVLGKSVVDNALKHVGRNYVYNIDLKDFFPSIDASRVWGRLLSPPFNLGDSEERRKIANMIKAICCTDLETERFSSKGWSTEIKNVLPQGAPTSPILSNAVSDKLDKRLAGVAKRFGVNYTRYADDITFSSMHNSYEISPGLNELIFKKDSFFDKEVRKIIAAQNFHINEKKVRLQKRGYRQEVTGLTVNEKINVSRRYIKQLRHWIYFCERYGSSKASELFINNYREEKINTDPYHIPPFRNILQGKLLYLKMVKGATDPTYLKLNSRFEKIKFTKIVSRFDVNIDTPVIVEWIHEIGLDKAMESYEIKNVSI